MRRHSRALFMLVLATLCWSISFPAYKAMALEQARLVPGVDSSVVAVASLFVRFCVGSLLLLLFRPRALGGLTRRELKQGLGLGFFATAGLWAQMDGLPHTEASTSAFLTQAYCVLIPLWTSLRARRWPSMLVVLCALLVTVGSGVLAELDPRHLELGRGEAMTLLASLFFAGQILMLGRPEDDGNDTFRVTLVMFLVIALLSVPAVSVHPGAWALLPKLYANAFVWFVTAILIAVCSFGGYFLMNHWQPFVSAAEAGILYCVEPVFASLLALVVPGLFSRMAGGLGYADERLRGTLLAGGALITLANLLIQIRPPTRREEESA